MWTSGKDGSPVFVLHSNSKEDEAAKVATLITRLRDENVDIFPLAVLYRINSQSLAFETEFARRHINFKILKGLRFFDRKEIKDTMALIKLAVNLNDDISFLRLVDCLPLGIGAKTLEGMSQTARNEGLSLFETMRNFMADKYSARNIFTAIFSLHQKYMTFEISVSEILTKLLAISGYREALEERGGARSTAEY